MAHHTLADLATAARHVADACRHVAQQEQLISILRSGRNPTDPEAEAVAAAATPNSC